MATKKAVVTGGSGFIGSSVVRLALDKGYDVTVVDDLSSGYAANLSDVPVELIEADIRDTEAVTTAVEGADVVFHLAASVGNTRSIEHPLEDSGVNLLGTLTVLEAARAAGARKLVFSSSAGVFGELKHLPISEDHPIDPDSPYGVSKLAAEKMCIAYSKLYELECVCLRYFNVYGPRQRYDAYGNVIPIFAHRLLRGDALTIYSDGFQTRDFVSVHDVARANLLAGEADGVVGAFNIASGTATVINDLAAMLAAAAGVELEVEHEPPRKGDVRDSLGDISAARSALKWEPTVAIEHGVPEYVEWLRADVHSRAL
jgi:UDP-glucose 4-epimerase